MKSCLIALGVICGVILLAVVALVVYAVTIGTQLDTSSHEYVNASNKAIISTWSEKELYSRASPELEASTTTEEVEKWFKLFRQLGALQIYESAEGGSHISITTQNGKVITGNYTAGATFENGKAIIETRVIQHDGEWKVLSFRIDSKTFLDFMDDQPADDTE
ncbi:MAG: hypothetical protein AAF571_00570 [Verrucomicrobiota bacterium]